MRYLRQEECVVGVDGGRFRAERLASFADYAPGRGISSERRPAVPRTRTLRPSGWSA